MRENKMLHSVRKKADPADLDRFLRSLDEPVQAPARKKEKSRNISITVYPGDAEKVRKIADFIRANSDEINVPVSRIYRAALLAVKPDEGFLKQYKQVR